MTEQDLASAQLDEETLRGLVLSTLQRHTEYAPEDFDDDADFESDLGVDSITLASVQTEIYEAVGLQDEKVRVGLANVGQLLLHINQRLQGNSISVNAAALQSKPASMRQLSDTVLVCPDGEMNVAAGIESPPADSQAQTIATNHQSSKAMWAEFFDRRNRDDDAKPHDAQFELADHYKLSFAAIGLGQKEISALHERLNSEHGLPANLHLADCDTPEKLLQYVKASRPHKLETLGSEHSEPSDSAHAQAEDDPRTMKDFVNVPNRDLFHKAREFRKFYVAKQQAQLYWYGMPLESQCRNRAVIYDEVTGRRREFLMFASNNYLGLASHPEVIEAIADGARRYGATNTGCRLIGGSNVLHKELERRLAKLKRREACIVYPSGYSANLGCISALVGRNDLVFTDAINHMSIQDGCKLSGASRKIYQHSMESLENTLKKYADYDGGKLIVTDGVFSMHGDIVDLPRLVELGQQYGARVMVDDAHSTGVLGQSGSGTAEHFGMKGSVDLELGTMSKALASVGGFVCADEEVVEYLRFYSNSYVFAATIPAAVASGVIASLDVMEREPQRLSRLWSNIHRLRGHLLGAGFNLERSNSAIIPVVVGDDRKTLELGRAVRARGMYCQTVVFPGVAVGDARLRISITSEHTEEDLDLAAQIVIDAAKEVKIPVTP